MTSYRYTVKNAIFIRCRFVAFLRRKPKAESCAKKPDRYEQIFNIQTDSEGVCTIFLYGDIGDYYEVQSGRVARELLEAEKAGAGSMSASTATAACVLRSIISTTPSKTARRTYTYVWTVSRPAWPA